jgi:hypothetical protein
MTRVTLLLQCFPWSTAKKPDRFVLGCFQLEAARHAPRTIAVLGAAAESGRFLIEVARQPKQFPSAHRFLKYLDAID